MVVGLLTFLASVSLPVNGNGQLVVVAQASTPSRVDRHLCEPEASLDYTATPRLARATWREGFCPQTTKQQNKSRET